MDVTNLVFPKAAHIEPPIEYEDYIYQLTNLYHGIFVEPGSQYSCVMGFKLDESLWHLGGRKDKERDCYIIDVSVTSKQEEKEASARIYFFDDKTLVPRIIVDDCRESSDLENLLIVLSLPEHKVVA